MASPLVFYGVCFCLDDSCLSVCLGYYHFTEMIILCIYLFFHWELDTLTVFYVFDTITWNTYKGKQTQNYALWEYESQRNYI